MRKFTLIIVAAFMAVAAYGQKQLLESKASVAPQMSLSPNMELVKKPTIHSLKNLRDNGLLSTKEAKSVRKAEKVMTINDLKGDYITINTSWEYDSEKGLYLDTIPQEAIPCQITTAFGNRINFTGLSSYQGTSNNISATVNVNDSTFSIMDAQVLRSGTGFTFNMKNLMDGDITGMIMPGFFMIDEFWFESLTYQGEQGRYGAYKSTVGIAPNATMTYQYVDKNKQTQTENVRIYLEGHGDTITVYNFADFMVVADIIVGSDKSFVVDFLPPVYTEYDSETSKDLYFHILGLGVDENGKEILVPLTGTGTENELKAEASWTLCDFDEGYWFGEKLPFTITLDEGYEFSYPEDTGVSSVKTAKQQNGKVFNLAGQQVKSGYKGIVIKDGKKFMMK